MAAGGLIARGGKTGGAGLSVAGGARFLVAPGLTASVVRAAHARGVPMLPGVATASEVEEALGLGLRHLKFFPALR